MWPKITKINKNDFNSKMVETSKNLPIKKQGENPVRSGIK